MKSLPLKYLTVFIIILFPHKITKDQLSHGNIESDEITISLYSENESPHEKCLKLELRESESIPTNQGEKVETIVISCPVSKYSEARLISLLTQKIVLSKKNYSLTSHYYLLISKTLQISPLVNILRV